MKPLLILELAKVAEGDFDKMKTAITQAAMAGGNVVKFQYYTEDELIKTHPNYERNKKCMFALDEIIELRDYAKDHGLESWCSAFGKSSMERLVGSFRDIKVPSTFLSHRSFINDGLGLFDNIHVSTGFHGAKDIGSLKKKYTGITGRNKNLIFYHCISEYPTQLENLKLERIRTMRMDGFSYHGTNQQAILTAIALGAKYIELHFNPFSSNSWQWSVPRIHSLTYAMAELQSMLKDNGTPSKSELDSYKFYKEEFRDLKC